MNFMSKATSPEDRSFSDLFQYYSETEEEFQKRLPQMINILIVDPAKTEKTHNAQSGFVVWGIDLDRQAYYVRQAFGDYFRTEKVCEVCFQLADQYKVDAIGFEVTGLEGWGIYTLKNYMSGRGGKQYHIEELKAKGGKGQLGGQDGAKIGRVNFGLLPLYEQGLVYHNRVGTGQLEQQELSFPRPERWDVLDAAAYIAPMLEKVLMYISPADWEKRVEGEIDKNIEREYEGLYDEPAFHRKEVGYYGL